MKKHLAHFGVTPGKLPRQKCFRVHVELMSKANLYHARMLELDSEEGDQSVGSPVDHVEGETPLHSWRIGGAEVFPKYKDWKWPHLMGYSGGGLC